MCQIKSKLIYGFNRTGISYKNQVPENKKALCNRQKAF
jgi:hypothetical protein